MHNTATEKICERIPFLDVAKGIGILLVILHHCIARSGTADAAMNRIAVYILSFHMPLFFFISGYLYHRKDTVTYMAGRVLGLLVPVMAFQAINAGISILLAVFKRSNPLGILFSGFWFIFAVLYASCAYHLVDRFLEEKLPRPGHQWTGHIVITVGVLLLAYGCSKLVGGTEDMLATAAAGYVFFAAGAYCKKILSAAAFLQDISWKTRCICAASGILLTAVLLITSSWNQQILMYISSYGSWRMFLLNAFVGIASIFLLSVAIHQCAWLEFFDRNSLIIMITHFPIYSFVLMTLQEYIQHSPILIIATFLITSVVEAPIAYFVDKYLPFLTGKYFKE